MEKEREVNRIKFHCEEVEDLIGSVPKGIMRYGLSLMGLVILCLIIVASFFSYPDLIKANIVLTSQSPPVSLKSVSKGKLEEIYCDENQYVNEGAVLAFVENSAEYKDVAYVLSYLDSLNISSDNRVHKELNLGELQIYYSKLQQKLEEYLEFARSKLYEAKIFKFNSQIQDNKVYKELLERKIKIEELRIEIDEKQLLRDKKLLAQGILSELEYENATRKYLESKAGFESSKEQVYLVVMKINHMKEEINELKLQKESSIINYNTAIQLAISEMREQIRIWEKKYLIKAPISGTITFSKIRHRYQNIEVGEILATVVPEKKTKIIGEVKVSSKGVGKIKNNQEIIIKLDNYPYKEYGIIKGKVKNVSEVPVVEEGKLFYLIEAYIPEPLLSTYNINILFSQGMSGTAEIVTAEIPLLVRIFSPLKDLLYN